MIISFSLRRPGPPAITRTHGAGAASRVLGSGLRSGGGSICARRAADARPVTSSARPARGGGGGRRLATVTPILDLPLGGWGEPGFNWRLFWGTQDAMLWKITDNVKYEEDCEVSWAEGRAARPRPSTAREAGAAHRTEVWGQGAGAAHRHPPLPLDGTGAAFPDTPESVPPGPLPESGLSPKIQPGERGLEREWQIPPTKLTGRLQATLISPSPRFLRRAPGPQPFLGRGSHARSLRPKGSDEATCQRHLCGGSSEAGLSPAPLPSRGKKKTAFS